MKLIDRLSPLFLAVITALLAIAAGVALNNAYAADVRVTWSMPISNTDGTSIPASGAGSIASTLVEYGSCAGAAFGTKAGEVTVNAPATSATVTGLAQGSTYCFQAKVRNTYGTFSEASNVVSKLVPFPVPNAPVLGANITIVYDLRGIGRDGTVLLGRAVGTVELGTPCVDYAYETNKGTYHMIDRANVKLVREPRSPAVVTKCAIG